MKLINQYLIIPYNFIRTCMLLHLAFRGVELHFTPGPLPLIVSPGRSVVLNHGLRFLL